MTCSHVPYSAAWKAHECSTLHQEVPSQQAEQCVYEVQKACQDILDLENGSLRISRASFFNLMKWSSSVKEV